MKKKNYIMSVPDDFLVEFIEAIRLGFNVKVTGLGIFSITNYKGGKVVHPVTKEEVKRPSFKMLKFRATLGIKELIQKIKI
jgi:nucleoid DNA-binding protein